MPNQSRNISQLLNERVKELNCLYEISKICQNYKQSFKVTINKIISAIPQGWQYPAELNIYLLFDDEDYGVKPTDNNITTATSPIVINATTRGKIIVYYKEDKKYSFLTEEQPLLDKIGIEIATFIERFEQRKKEELMAEKMRYNDRLTVLGELTAGIAHELNTPLGNILGYAELLNSAEVNPIKKADIQKIISSAKNAREIVKRLMYFSCEMPQQFGLANINEQIEENIGLLQKQLGDNQVQLTLNLSDNIPLVRLDKLQFSQVLFNLVLNAINAIKTNGKITITTSQEEKNVILRIIDNGKGMSKDTRTKIFQPFFTTKPKGEGTGLGLAVVHGIVQNHKGTINVNSVVNKGTEFIITFPIETN
ncbi:MAG: HAMP domain-containing histidine kinase [Flavobacteriales bacterium]|nr:HAMP domain-containing histidine kinase [Flavobacteriales bacterium]MCB9364585.1 HAMP domain-containing histidine kinase [Flavobacteriales bacterium]